MKLVKILSPTPTVGIKEKVTLDEHVLLSDAKFRLLQLNHVNMSVELDFVDSNSEDIVDFNREKPYIIQKIVPDPTNKFSGEMPEVVDGVIDCKAELADIEVGKCILYYVPKPPVSKEEILTEEQLTAQFTALETKFKPVKPEYPAIQTEDSLKAYYKAMNIYQMNCNKWANIVEIFEIKKKENAKWTKEYEAWEKAVKSQAYGLLIEKTNETTATVICDVSFLTTKTDPQFHSYGRFPLDAPLKVTKGVGDIKAEDTLKGMTWVDIMAKAFGLESETPVKKTIKLTEENADSSDVSGS